MRLSTINYLIENAGGEEALTSYSCEAEQVKAKHKRINSLIHEESVTEAKKITDEIEKLKIEIERLQDKIKRLKCERVSKGKYYEKLFKKETERWKRDKVAVSKKFKLNELYKDNQL